MGRRRMGRAPATGRAAARVKATIETAKERTLGGADLGEEAFRAARMGSSAGLGLHANEARAGAGGGEGGGPDPAQKRMRGSNLCI